MHFRFDIIAVEFRRWAVKGHACVIEHIPVVRFIINKRNSFITTVADYSILKKDVQGCNLREKR